jgi:hypothetical protein
MVRPGSDGPLAALLASLADALAEEPRAEAFAAALETIDPPASVRSRAASELPVLDWWDECLAQTGPASMHATVRALDELRPALTFTQNPNYVASPPSPGFLARYGYAVIAGPRSGPPALVAHDGLAFGVLLLGPETTYPTHLHPAAELYLPLGPADWSVRGSPLGERASGSPIVHAPNEPHVTRTGRAPLAALYVWLGSLDVDARFVTPP